VHWRDVEDPELSSQMGTITGRDSRTTLEAIRMRIQAYNGTLHDITDENAGKFGCIIFANGFMRLARRGNNQDKETLIDIPHVLWSP